MRVRSEALLYLRRTFLRHHRQARYRTVDPLYRRNRGSTRFRRRTLGMREATATATIEILALGESRLKFMRNRPECEKTQRVWVDALLKELGRPATQLESPGPPAPDVRATFAIGAEAEVFAVTEIDPRALGEGRVALNEQGMHRNAAASYLSWVPIDPLPALRYHILQESKRALDYRVRFDESLSLLLANSRSGTAESTFAFSPFSTEQLNVALDRLLKCSRFQHAYLHIPTSMNPLWMWSRSRGWRDLPVSQARERLEKCKDSLGPARTQPDSPIFRRWLS